MQELFELADKSKFLSASLIQIDIQELNNVDNFKEGYQYTKAYAKFLKMIKYKELYLSDNEPDYFKVEIEKCFEKLDGYIRVYETMFLLASFSQEIKIHLNRVMNIKHKESLINIINKVIYLSS
jgi:hypothetical protein